MVRTDGWDAWLERQLEEVRREDLPEFLGSLERVRGRAYLRLLQAPAPVQTEPLLTAGEAAVRLALPRSRVYGLARQGLLPHLRIGRQLRFSPAALDAWSEGR